MQQPLGGLAEPRIARTLTLHFRGDWGHANLHRVCGWLGSEMCARMGSGSRFAIWNGRGFHGVDPNGEFNRTTLDEMQDYFVKIGSQERKLDLATIIDISYVERAVQRLGRLA